MNRSIVDTAGRLGSAATLLLLLVALTCGQQGEGEGKGERKGERKGEGEGEGGGAGAAFPEAVTVDTAATQTSERVRDPGRLIRSDGIGHARAGMTIGDLRGALPAGTTLGPPRPYMVDIDAMPVVQGGDTLYVVLIPSGDPSSDDARINLVATTDTTVRTAEGIGPGTALADAAAVYGAPGLAYNIDDESREYATFPDLPRTIRVRVQPAGDTAAFAGVYTTSHGYNETFDYDPAARVMMVQVLMR